ALPWWESMDPPAETDRTTPDLLNRTDLRAQNVHTPAEKAAPAHTALTACQEEKLQSFQKSNRTTANGRCEPRGERTASTRSGFLKSTMLQVEEENVNA
ncbi:solute carrier family 2, facilitated glucose transporter member 12, partial [Tachysurus ichikawai]